MVSRVVLHGCPRCDGPLDFYDRFPRCVVCGWQEYRTRDTRRKSTSSVSSHRSTRRDGPFPDRVAYRGDGPRFKFADKIEARLAHSWRETVLLCPYDGALMRHAGPASARTPFVQAFACEGRKHRVRLWRQTDGEFAWR